MQALRKLSLVCGVLLLAAMSLLISDSQSLSLPAFKTQAAVCCASKPQGCGQHCQKSCCETPKACCKKCGKSCCEQAKDKCEVACSKGH